MGRDIISDFSLKRNFYTKGSVTLCVKMSGDGWIAKFFCVFSVVLKFTQEMLKTRFFG